MHWKIIDLITDPSAGQLSTSRVGLLIMNMVGAEIASLAEKNLEELP
jgi:hypothetical protein